MKSREIEERRGDLPLVDINTALLRPLVFIISNATPILTSIPSSSVSSAREVVPRNHSFE